MLVVDVLMLYLFMLSPKKRQGNFLLVSCFARFGMPSAPEIRLALEANNHLHSVTTPNLTVDFPEG